MATYYVYIVECADGTLYTGYTTNLSKRLAAHNGTGVSVGAKYTAGRRPVVLRYVETHADKSSALKREYEIKQLTKSQKRQLIATPPIPIL